MSGPAQELGKAERLYYDSPELNFAARVTDVRLVSHEKQATGEKTQVWQVALDRTAFYPESGGQPWDTGVLVATARSGAVLEVPVERVEEDAAGEVWHTVRKPLVEGTVVEGRVDPERRLDHTQQHSGQHLLSAVFLAELGAKTVSFHLGVENATIDLNLPEGQSLTQPELDRAERVTNRNIAQNRPVRTSWHAREDAEAMVARGQLRKIPERQGPLRVVEIEGVEWNACGGTHVGSTAAIGVVLLRGLEKVKGGWRVSFVCGLRAADRARKDFALLYAASQQMTVGIDQVPERLAPLLAENKSTAKEKALLLAELATVQAVELLRVSPEGEVIQAVFPGRPVEFGRRIASHVSSQGRFALIGTEQNGEASLQVSVPKVKAVEAGTLVRALTANMEVRGGGGAQTAQLMCAPAVLPEAMRALAEQMR